jgi:hypothetical protein
MLRKLVVVCALISVFSILAVGQEASETSKVDIFGGYQYVHANSGVSGVDGINFNGWNASLTGYFNRNLGVTADFSGNYSHPSVLGIGVDTKFYSYLFGPSVRFPNASHITPFGHALFGGGHFSAGALGFSGSDSGFTWAAGGGLDLDMSRHLGIRLAQVDFLQTRVSGSSQNNVRLSVGIVFKL